MWQYIKNFVIDHQSKVVKQIFKKASKNNFRWEMYYFFCSIKNLLPHIQNEYNKKYVQERNTLCTFCARTMFSLSRIDRIIFLCVFKMKKKKSDFLSGIQRILMMMMKLRKKTKRKRRNILYFVHIQLQQSNFTKILSIAIRDTDRPKTTKNQNDKQFYYHFWDSFCQVREIKKKYKVVKLTNFFFVNLNSSKVLTYEFPMRSEENELYTKGTSLMELDVVDRKARTQRI